MTTGTVAYTIKYSRRRSIGIIVTPGDGVIVRAPYRTPVHLIEKFVRAKSDWINRHLENYSDSIRLNHTDLVERKSILYHGIEHRLTVAVADRNSVVLGENEVLVRIKNPEDAVSVKNLVDSWYRKMASKQTLTTMEEILDRYKAYGFSPSAVSVRAMKRRWGSCSSKGKITINSELIKLDNRYLEYVILHELCHLRHHNHSHDYYRLLSEVYPGWKGTKKELRRYIT